MKQAAMLAVEQAKYSSLNENIKVDISYEAYICGNWWHF
ncbi:hypothetical protein OOU_Y34scaffold00995g10 [Pyricularia oryzae Y34]|uniref:Uncharacterized protein n=2 Tax=Pyricularia oryzae TaxID=318829 RepID=A0AA97NN09_PYRO3|nr:hypothetical protein OOU_Y34scaffold00995g10 [Pyricularia oryzae Y34]